MASGPDRAEDISNKLKSLTLKGVKPLADQEMGRGAYGKVYKVKYGGIDYAAKEIHPTLLEEVPPEQQQFVKDNFIRECCRCSELTHPNIVEFMGIYYPSGRRLLPAMVMELMDESLTAFAEKKRNFDLKRKLSILHDVAEGLNYLHSCNPPIIHRDLTPNNVLLKHITSGGLSFKQGDEDKALLWSVAKIADLGVARNDRQTTRTSLTRAPGLPDFMPPEALQVAPVYNTSLDVFCYGGIMLHTINEEWPTPKPSTLFDPVTRETKGLNEVERRQEHLDKMTKEAEMLKPLITSCLDNDPVKRPPIADLSKTIKPLKESLPLVSALQSGYYELTWEKCADLQSPLYGASAVLHKENIYVMAGDALQDETYNYVFSYNININEWSRLPPPGHYMGKLQIINNLLTVIGGVDNATKELTNKVSTFNNNSNKWTDHYPNMLEARHTPGVVNHEDHVIVLGGAIDTKRTCLDDIEVLNWRSQPLQWIRSNIKLPQPMFAISSTISHDELYILGYTTSGTTYSTAYQVPVEPIISSISQPPTSGQSVNWNKLPDAPHYYTALLPHSYPPVIIGGSDIQGVPTSDIAIYNLTEKTWDKVTSLSTARKHVAVVPISHESIIVIGGCTGGIGVAGAKAHSTTTVEKGRVTLSHTMPTQDSACTIQ